MTTLGDTFTPSLLTSAADGVSIKVEQGVLCENNECEGSRFDSIEKQCISTQKFESNHPNNTKSTSNSKGDSNNHKINITHNISQPDCKVKEEPSIDIDDGHAYGEAKQACPLVPKIILTPTSKLIASPTGPTDNKRRYACPYDNCTKSYGKSSHLRSHLTWHTGIKPFVCKEPSCGKGFTRSDELNRHMRTHTGEKPFECVQCSKKFSRSDHLTKHLVTHSKQLAANGAFLKKNKFDKYVLHDTFKTIYPTVALVAKDNQNAKVVGTSVSETKSNSPELTYCVKQTQATSLKIKLERPEDSDDYIRRFPEQELKIVRCQTLPVPEVEPIIKIENDSLVKQEPINDLHASVSAEPYTNEPDDDAIMPEANLPPLSSPLNQTITQSANSFYDPTRPFSCYHCTKSFKRQDDLNRHLRTHTGEKPFACNECDKRFMRSDHLKKHMNTHTRVR